VVFEFSRCCSLTWQFGSCWLCFPAFCGEPFLFPMFWHFYTDVFLLHRSPAVRGYLNEISFSEFAVHTLHDKMNIHVHQMVFHDLAGKEMHIELRKNE